MLEKTLVFIFGSIVGSFLNVCIYRMPLEQSVVAPRSFCPHCKKMIPWFDNIPFISYILLGGRCRSCKERISPRYFIVELITAGTFLLFYNLFGISFAFFYYVIFVSGLIIATFIDIAHRIIPDEISVGGLVVGLLLNAFRGLELSPLYYDWHPVWGSFLGILVGGGVIYLSGFIFDIVYFKLLKKPAIQGETESMGGGDVKLLAMIGAFLGWQMALIGLVLGCCVGAVIGTINFVVKKDHTIPFGPFLAIGALIALFWADKIVNYIFMLQQ